ncbi:MAG: NAD-dependent epimerase/dehydratase family protein [Acidobacteria bacterium]|nr:NAD-dependent epimerase/dehydratase family protein [Acidobacteriota bacterium]
MRVLITGGAGFVGSGLAIEFKKRRPDSHVIAFDNLRRRGSELNLRAFKELGIRFVHGDVRQVADLAELREDFDLLIEASAEPSVQAGINGSADYLVETNLLGSFNCLNFARNHAARVIFLSTSRVYSIGPLRAIKLEETGSRFEIAREQTQEGVSQLGISETFPTHLPRSLYGATKLASEYLVQEFTETYEMKSIIYRCGVIAGPGQFGRADQGVFTLWVANHFFKKPLWYTGFGGQGKQVRDILHPLDLFLLIEKQLADFDRYSGCVYNIGGGAGSSVSLAEMTALCREVVGNSVPISSQLQTHLVDVPLYISDCRRIDSTLQWRPTRSVRDIVADIFHWIRDNEEDLKAVFA